MRTIVRTAKNRTSRIDDDVEDLVASNPTIVRRKAKLLLLRGLPNYSLKVKTCITLPYPLKSSFSMYFTGFWRLTSRATQITRRSDAMRCTDKKAKKFEDESSENRAAPVNAEER